MAKSTVYAGDLLELVFNATTIANIADDAATSPATTIECALHTADPGAAGNQSTSEATYTSYARVTVARTTGGWTVTSNSVSPVANIVFPTATGGTNTITHWSAGTGVSNALLYSGTVTPNISVTTGIAPTLTTATAGTET